MVVVLYVVWYGYIYCCESLCFILFGDVSEGYARAPCQEIVLRLHEDAARCDTVFLRVSSCVRTALSPPTPPTWRGACDVARGCGELAKNLGVVSWQII